MIRKSGRRLAAFAKPASAAAGRSEKIVLHKDFPANGADRQRIDRWLWHARVVRTRAAAAMLTSGGCVRVNGTRILAPGRMVAKGDVITVALDYSVRVLKVRGFVERRGPAAAGETLYEELT
jgi:ribosome-associated heat shock protein Hsp15